MNPNRNPWLDKAEKLALLAEAKRNRPEGDAVLSKLRLALKRHPEVRRQVMRRHPLLECDLFIAELTGLTEPASLELVS